MMKKRFKQGGALILAAVLAVSAFAVHRSYAADSVKVDEKCSITYAVDSESFKEVKVNEVTVNLFKVADIDVTGDYTVKEAYASVLDLSDIGPDLTANKWEEKTLAVKTLIDTVNADDDSTNDVVGTTNTTNLETGMYFVYPDQYVTDNYVYDFTPSLVSLPNNEYYKTNNDSWVYDVTVNLKPERSDRYGDLVINKELTEFNASVGGATFVFEVNAVKTDVDTNEEVVVYSDVVSMTFNAAGTKSVKIKNIEAGAVVTVTEVYSGASYQLVAGSEKVVSTTILADDEVAVGFTNENNDGLNGGSGLVNTFTFNEDGSFGHNATTDSTGSEIIAKNVEK